MAAVNHTQNTQHVEGVQDGGLVVDVAWCQCPMSRVEQRAMNNVRLRGVTKNDVGRGGDEAIATPPGDSNAAFVDHDKDNNDVGNSKRQLCSGWVVGA